jgi:cell division protein FtsI (penicillin-binding protein 3)
MTSNVRSGSHSSKLTLSKHPSHRRLFAMLVVFLLMFGVIIGRMGYLQVASKATLDSAGEMQRIRSVKLSAERGSIFDRSGQDLALSVPQQTVWADPKMVADPFKAAALLAPLLNMDVYALQEKLNQDGRFTYLARKVDDAVAERVKELKLDDICGEENGVKVKCIAMYEEPKRFLPDGDLVSSVVGRVGVDNEGLSGLESQFEKQLSGSPGRLRVEQDPFGRDIPGGLRSETPAVRGEDLMLTIDRDLQYKVDQAMRDQIDLSNAKGGMAAVMDVTTGEVLALVNLNRNTQTGEIKAAPNNMALTNVYEPGSTSKLLTISAALETGTVTPSTVATVSDHMQIYDSEFKDAEPHPTQQWTTTDILTASSNIGTIQIAQKLGKDRLDQFQRAFGFGSGTGLHYPGESAGLLTSPKKYSGTTLATTAIGQGVSTTTMQMLAAFNTIANGGLYVAPKLIKSTIDSDGKEKPTPASSTRQVVSEQTAAQMNLMLQEVVRVGTATSAQIDGYDVAGKTGTARKPNAAGTGYQDGAYISSFAGFAPAGKPKFTAIVILDEPTPIYGGLVAAPVYADITRYALQEFGIDPAPQSEDRRGVPVASSTASSAADESSAAPAGTTAQDAKEVTANANGKSTSKSTSSTSTPAARKPSTSTSTTAPR